MKTISAIFHIFVFSAVLTILIMNSPAVGDDLAWRTQYDGQGRIFRRVDPAGRVLTYTYTPPTGGPLQRITAKPSQGPSVEWHLDPQGRITAMQDGLGDVAYQYDSHGRLSVVSRKGAPAIRYRYDTAGRISELRIGDVYRVARTYDFLGRIATIDTPAGRIHYTYQAGHGAVIQKLPNGVRTKWTYAPNGMLEEISHAVSSSADDSRYRTMADYRYSYGADGRISAIRERSRRGAVRREYQYDTMGRLVNATEAIGATRATGQGGRKYQYAYDQAGNRTEALATGRSGQACTYDWAGRLTSLDGEAIAYDAAGNLTGGAMGRHHAAYHYHFDSRLAAVERDGEIVQYRYDGFGCLVSRKTSRGEMRFVADPLSDSWRPLVITDANGRQTLLVWDGDRPVAQVRAGKVEWFHLDHLASVRLITDANGEVIGNRRYSPFGIPDPPSSHPGPAMGFAGLMHDAEAGIYLAKRRAYLPELGMFLQPEPEKPVFIQSERDTLLYSYCFADPVNYTDTNGAWPKFRGGKSEDMVYEQYTYTADDRRWLLETLNRYQAEALGDKKLKELSHAQRCKIRKAAVVKFASDWALYGASYKKKIGIYHLPENQAVWEARISNRSIQTDIGLVNMDWLTTLVSVMNGAGPFEAVAAVRGLRDNPIELYRFGKDLWIKYGTKSGERPPHDPNNPYPQRDLNAVSIIEDRLFDPDIPFEAVFLPPNTPKSIHPHRVTYDYYRNSGTHIVGTDSTATRYTARGNRIFKTTINRSQYNETDRGVVRAREALSRFTVAGGDGQSAGRLGRGSADARAAVANFNLMSSAALSRVGGVSLSGAGETMDGLGLLNGVAFDRNDNLLLVGPEDQRVKLPPLRLDDVVTIFRSVYIHGEGPTVTIDPASENPESSAMVIRHGKATEATYVGWILYQADRLMKGYTIGVDNKTTKDVTSRVDGYPQVLDTLYFGGSGSGRRARKGQWERFWIVPDKTWRFEGPLAELTLVAVPLKVNTQLMAWHKGRLVDDKKGKSSPGALAFKEWFTGHYDQIAQERYLPPPPETGISVPVPVFTELRRIALITAIAEKLRDSGVPMPFWMFDYEIQPVAFEKITPALRVPRSKGKVRASVFGGVQLSPATAAIKKFRENTDLTKLSSTDRKTVVEMVALTKGVEKTLARAKLKALPLTPEKLNHKGRDYHVVAMPGPETRVLGPLRLAETDISVPLPGDRALELTRRHNSFFAPNGVWGKGWALDLPRLVEIRRPLIREGSKVKYGIAYELISPLNSVRARFFRRREVAALNNAKLLVPEEAGAFIAMSQTKPVFLSVSTRMVFLNDGSRWHFSKAGQLAAVERAGLVTVYERDRSGRITRVIGSIDGQKAGEILLKYDKAGRLARAEGKNSDGDTAVTYAYTANGRLKYVQTDSGRVGYHYGQERVSQGRVEKITWLPAKERGGGKVEHLRSFEYNSQGQLVQHTTGHLLPARYHWTEDPLGWVVKVGKGAEQKTLRFDTALRPISAQQAGGTQAVWRYPDKGGMQMEISGPDRTVLVVKESADKRTVTYKTQGRPAVVFQKDAAGRLVSVAHDGRPVVRQHWQGDGRLQRIETTDAAVWREYDRHGLVAALLVAPVGHSGSFKRFRRVQFDAHGRAVEVKDHTGLHRVWRYDKSGAIVAAVDKSAGRNIGYTFDRDKSGRLLAVNSTWGSGNYTYAASGGLSRIRIERQGKTAAADFDNSGRVIRFRHFDGGETQLDYFRKGPHKGRPRRVQSASGLELVYAYNDAARLKRVAVGRQRRLALDYDKAGRIIGYNWQPAKPSPSPVRKGNRFQQVIKGRIADSQAACRLLPNAVVFDLYKHSDGRMEVNIHSSTGRSRKFQGDDARELEKMIRSTFASNRSEKLEANWEAFYRGQLSDLATSEKIRLPGGSVVRLKPVLIVKSNLVNYKFANLKRMSALWENFNIIVASKKENATEAKETSATKIAEKLKAVPRVTRKNVVFAIRPPEDGATQKTRARWEKLVGELRGLVGRDNVVFNPDKKAFGDVFARKGKDIIVIEITHTDKGIPLKGGESFNTADILGLGDLSSVKLLIGGNSCQLPKIDRGKFLQALLRQGVGIVNATNDTVQQSTVFERVELFKILLKHAADIHIPAYQWLDIIDQANTIPKKEKGTTNLGQIESDGTGRLAQGRS